MEKDRALGYNFKNFCNFPDLSKFSRIQSLKSIGNSWGNLYIPCLVPIIALRFTCGARKICNNIIKSQNMKMIVVWNKWFLKDQYWFLSYFFYMSITSNMLQIFRNMFIVIICVPYCGVINFEIHLSLLIKLFSFSKVLVRWNREHSSFLKGSHWSKENRLFLDGGHSKSAYALN